MSEHWPVSNEGVGTPPQPLERENARLREALKYYAHYFVSDHRGALARAALGDQTEEAEDG